MNVIRLQLVNGGTDDLQLLRAWREGNDEAGSQLFERHVVGILRFFNNKAPQDAEDLVQQTFMACVESRDRFREDSSFRGYLYGIARRVLLMHLRTRSRARREFDPAVMSVMDSGMGPVRAATREDEQQVLAEALGMLPVDWQICVELFYWENLEIQEIAAALDAPIGTIKSRLSRARSRLQEEIRGIVTDERLLESTLSGLEKWTRALGNGAAPGAILRS